MLLELASNARKQLFVVVFEVSPDLIFHFRQVFDLFIATLDPWLERRDLIYLLSFLKINQTLLEVFLLVREFLHSFCDWLEFRLEVSLLSGFLLYFAD